MLPVSLKFMKYLEIISCECHHTEFQLETTLCWATSDGAGFLVSKPGLLLLRMSRFLNFRFEIHLTPSQATTETILTYAADPLLLCQWFPGMHNHAILKSNGSKCWSKVPDLKSRMIWLQELVYSSSAYAPIKRLLNILEFNPSKDLEAEGDLAEDADLAKHRVSVDIWRMINRKAFSVEITQITCSYFYISWLHVLRVCCSNNCWL